MKEVAYWAFVAVIVGGITAMVWGLVDIAKHPQAPAETPAAH